MSDSAREILLRALKKAGIKVSESASDAELARAVVQQLNNERGLRIRSERVRLKPGHM